jgi:catechol 2,3-dioxygenase-like lactoylglutathione lyase family enzyme
MTAWLPTMRSPAALKKPKPMIERFDHIVLTVADLEPSIAFYNQVLQMQEHSFGQGRKALCFGRQKINCKWPDESHATKRPQAPARPMPDHHLDTPSGADAFAS